MWTVQDRRLKTGLQKQLGSVQSEEPSGNTVPSRKPLLPPKAATGELYAFIKPTREMARPWKEPNDGHSSR